MHHHVDGKVHLSPFRDCKMIKHTVSIGLCWLSNNKALYVEYESCVRKHSTTILSGEIFSLLISIIAYAKKIVKIYYCCSQHLLFLFPFVLTTSMYGIMHFLKTNFNVYRRIQIYIYSKYVCCKTLIIVLH